MGNLVKHSFTLFKARLLNSSKYKIDFWSSAISPLFSILPALVAFLFLKTTLGSEIVNSKLGTKNYYGYIILGVFYWNYVEILWSSVFRMREDMRIGKFEDIYLSPVTPLEYIIGNSFYGIVYVTIESIPLLVLAFLTNIFSITPINIIYAVGTLVLSMIASFGMTFFIFGLTLLLKEGDQLASLIGNIAPFLGGLFFPLTHMPSPLKEIGFSFPFSWGVDIMRSLITKSSLIFPIHYELLILSALSVIYLILGIAAFIMTEKKSRQNGIHGF